MTNHPTRPQVTERESLMHLIASHVGHWLKELNPTLQLIPTAARQDIRELADAILALKGAVQPCGVLTPDAWQPIWTAPKDGTDFLALCEYERKHHQMVGCFAPNGKFASWPGRNNYHPTYWMPLPASPVSSADRGGE